MFLLFAPRTSKKPVNGTEGATLSIAIESEGHCDSRLRQSENLRRVRQAGATLPRALTCPDRFEPWEDDT